MSYKTTEAWPSCWVFKFQWVIKQQKPGPPVECSSSSEGRLALLFSASHLFEVKSSLSCTNYFLEVLEHKTATTFNCNSYRIRNNFSRLNLPSAAPMTFCKFWNTKRQQELIVTATGSGTIFNLFYIYYFLQSKI